MTSQPKFHFKNLDSIRTIAFVSTFLAHAFYTQNPIIENTSIFQTAIRFQEVFGFGVPVFFVLSGFLITYLMFLEYEKTGTFSVRDFYMRRVLRIWPVFFLVVFIGFVVFPFFRSQLLGEPHFETARWWMYVSFLSNFDQIKLGLPYGVGLGPTWSVSVEEQFYFLWPLLFVAFKFRKMIFPILIVFVFSITISLLFNLRPTHTVYCMVYLSIGALCGYLAYFKNTFVLQITNVHILVPIGVILSLIFLMNYYGTFSFSYMYIPLIALMIGYVILHQCYGNNLNFGSIPFFERLGKYTYGLYLYHVVCNFIAHVLIDDIFIVNESLWMVIVVKPEIKA
jgi:peptidoglycan/LPS O-acetylase OafA/YrhL